MLHSSGDTTELFMLYTKIRTFASICRTYKCHSFSPVGSSQQHTHNFHSITFIKRNYGKVLHVSKYVDAIQ